ESLLVGEDFLPDPAEQLRAVGSDAEEEGPSVGRVGFPDRETLSLQAVHDPAGRALVEVEATGEFVHRERAGRTDDLERVTLSDGKVVTADQVAVAELADADKLGKSVVQVRGV